MRIKCVIAVLLCVLLIPISARAAECFHEYSDSCDAVCNLCSEERTPPHSLTAASEWCDGGEYHFIPCADCSSELFSMPHDSDLSVSTEEGHGTACSVCKGASSLTPHSLILTNDGTKGHSYSCAECEYKLSESHATVCEEVDGGHAFFCECGYRSRTAVHSFESPCTEECTECGYIRVAPHEYREPAVDESGHYFICALCYYAPDTNSHTRKYTHNSLGHFSSCTECGYDFGFEKHTADDGGCPCGYTEQYFPSTDKDGDHSALLWVLVGALSAVLCFLVFLKRRRIAVLFSKVKRKFFPEK